ncbi:hypothetical protein RRG08_057674 [Elysia crispata]|uniref:Uncharacterized protein n=1 Tax=Elysia crispata TaxID=231223 RepID=A0AAE0XZ76_9GAST|nr:hypothetical protein RRG08_057674 [Elysia crispata]
MEDILGHMLARAPLDTRREFFLQRTGRIQCNTCFTRVHRHFQETYTPEVDVSFWQDAEDILGHVGETPLDTRRVSSLLDNYNKLELMRERGFTVDTRRRQCDVGMFEIDNGELILQVSGRSSARGEREKNRVIPGKQYENRRFGFPRGPLPDPLNLPNSFDQLDPSDFILIQDTPVDVSLADVEDILGHVGETPLDTRREFLPPGVSSLLDNYVARAMRERGFTVDTRRRQCDVAMFGMDNGVYACSNDVIYVCFRIHLLLIIQRTGRSSVTHASQECTGTARRHERSARNAKAQERSPRHVKTRSPCDAQTQGKSPSHAKTQEMSPRHAKTRKKPTRCSNTRKKPQSCYNTGKEPPSS